MVEGSGDAESRQVGWACDLDGELRRESAADLKVSVQTYAGELGSLVGLA